ncbi:M16 family metallopeptidase [Mucilaginibacter sp. Mucisp84]|uniref:M16 family metallopeptidase n=1 Tax=Mucilaginibacter sp. Mucisp84 TaxID=3243058 RepID=UPI0039A4D78B
MKQLFNNRQRLVAAAGVLIFGLCTNKVYSQLITHVTKTHSKDGVLPLDPRVRTGKLANGFTYYIRHNEDPKNRVVFYLANKVGSILERNEQQGLAHFLEHMNFNGTKHFPKSDLVNYLQKTGVRFGADLNAYTSFDETVYQLPLPSDDPGILAQGIQIMRDWAQEATLDPEEINKERGVVLEEKRLGKGAQDRMQRQYWPVMLNHSRYATRMPIGTDSVLTRFKPETIRSFYRDWYRPDLQALIIVGDIDVNEMEKSILKKFSDLKNPKNEKSRTQYTIPLSGKNQFLTVTDQEMTSTVLQIIIKHPGHALKTAGDFRQSIIRELFNFMMNERITELQRQANPPFISGGAGIGELLGGIDQFSVFVNANPGQLEKGLKAIWRETDRIKKLGFTPTELARAKQNYLNKMEAGVKESKKVNSDSYVNEYLQYFLKGTASPGIQFEYTLLKKSLPGINLSDLNNLARGQIKTNDRDIFIMAPDKDKAILPDEKTVLTWMSQVEQEKQSQYQNIVNQKPLLITKPKSGRIISVSTDSLLNITTVQFANHVKVILKPTNFKDNQILFSGSTPGGSSLYRDSDYESASNAAGIISSFGAGNYNPIQLNNYLSGKQIGVHMQMSERATGVSGSSVPAELENALELLYAYYTQPRKDKDLFAGLIAKSKASLENRANSSVNVFQDTIYAVLGNHNIRRSGPSISKIDQISLDRAFDIYKERFGNASGSTFTFVGNFDVKTIQPLLLKYIGSLPALDSVMPARDLDINIPEGNYEKKVFKGTEDKATVLLVWSGKFKYSQSNLYTMDALKEVLTIRLLERLREEESGVYTPSASVNVSKLPQERFSLIVNFGCAPSNVDKLIVSTLDEVAKLIRSGPEPVNVNKWRAEALRSQETEVKTNEWWLGYISDKVQNEEHLEDPRIYTGLINTVKPTDIKNLAVKYLNGENFIKLILLPESSKLQ